MCVCCCVSLVLFMHLLLWFWSCDSAYSQIYSYIIPVLWKKLQKKKNPNIIYSDRLKLCLKHILCRFDQPKILLHNKYFVWLNNNRHMCINPFKKKKKFVQTKVPFELLSDWLYHIRFCFVFVVFFLSVRYSLCSTLILTIFRLCFTFAAYIEN